MQQRLLFNVNIAWFFISHRLPIARAARDAGFEVHVSGDIDSDAEMAAIAGEGIVFHRVRLSRGGMSPVHDLGYMSQVASVIRTVRPDIIHNITVKPIVYGSLAARALRVPRIVNAVSGLGYAFSVSKHR
jgi:hypothetical protein